MSETRPPYDTGEVWLCLCCAAPVNGPDVWCCPQCEARQRVRTQGRLSTQLLVWCAPLLLLAAADAAKLIAGMVGW